MLYCSLMKWNLSTFHWFMVIIRFIMRGSRGPATQCGKCITTDISSWLYSSNRMLQVLYISTEFLLKYEWKEISFRSWPPEYFLKYSAHRSKFYITWHVIEKTNVGYVMKICKYQRNLLFQTKVDALNNHEIRKIWPLNLIPFVWWIEIAQYCRGFNKTCHYAFNGFECICSI